MTIDPTLNLQAVLGGAVSANQPEFHVHYVLWNAENIPTKPSPYRGALNNNTDVTLLAAPPQSYTAEIHALTIYNKDTANVDVTVKTDDGSTERIIIRRTIPTQGTLQYTKEYGWRV